MFEIYRRTIYYEFNPKLSIIIIKNNNGYTLFTYSSRFSFNTYDTLEELWINLVKTHKVYYFIDLVKPAIVLDTLRNTLSIYALEGIFNYSVYWENRNIVRYMMTTNILFVYPIYNNLYSLVADKKWGCFDLVTRNMLYEFDDIFEKLPEEYYPNILELGLRLKRLNKLDFNDKIKAYLDNHNAETMKKLEPFMKYERLPLDVSKLIGSYLLY